MSLSLESLSRRRYFTPVVIGRFPTAIARRKLFQNDDTFHEKLREKKKKKKERGKGDEREKSQESPGGRCRAETETDLISESSGIVTPVGYNSAIIKVAQGRIKRYVCPAALLRDPFLD